MARGVIRLSHADGGKARQAEDRLARDGAHHRPVSTARSIANEEALGHSVRQVWPTPTLAVFVGMMFGAMLGRSATPIGGSANVVAAGMVVQNRRVMTFARFARYDVPIVLA
jgi:hypothetical protein